MDEISTTAGQVRGTSDLPGLLDAGFEAFEVIRSIARACEDRTPHLFPAFLMAATAAVEGRNTLNDAPSLPPAHGRPPVPVVTPGADVALIAGELAELAKLLAQRLRAVAPPASRLAVPPPSLRTSNPPRPGQLDIAGRAIADARIALRQAAARMRMAADALGSAQDQDHPCAERLAAATRCLAAGHDLLQTHFAPSGRTSTTRPEPSAIRANKSGA